MRSSEFIKETKSPLQKIKDFDKSRAAAGKKPIFTDKKKDDKEEQQVDEQNPAANAKALVGSGRGPTGTNPKGKGDSPAHRAVRTPGTTYSKRPNQKKYGKPGAEDGFIG